MALALREERDTGHQRAGKVDFFDYEALAQSVPHHRGSGGGVCGISEERGKWRQCNTCRRDLITVFGVRATT